MSENSEWTVGKFLIYRLKQVGVRHLFGIPGDYIVDFVLEANDAGIKHVVNTNEINGGYAADAYARLNGISAIAVTYGVGGFSLLNTIAGAYIERVPIIAINGAPSIAKHLEDRDTGLLWHHMINGQNNDLEMYRRITVAAEQLKNPALAPGQIDQAITTCLTESRPIYLETFEDIYAQPCAAPEGELAASPVPAPAANLQDAVSAAAAKIKASQHPILWGGVEVQRYRIQDSFESLVDSTGLHYATSLLGKSVLNENNPAYIGVYEGQSSNAGVIPIIQNSDCLIGLGVLTTDINLLGATGVTGDELTGRVPWGDDFILAANDSVRVGTNYFAQVALGDFIDGLCTALAGYSAPPLDPPLATAPAPDEPDPSAKLTFDNFFGRMSSFVDDSMIVLADIGFSSFGAMNFKIQRRSGFICQAAYASIGYAVGATLGTKLADPSVRPITFTGDGSFHMTCQAIGTMIKEGQNPIIFVMNNGIFGIEQWLVNAKAFEDPPADPPVDIASTNILHRWDYSKLTDVFGGRGWAVETLAELDTALGEIRDDPDTLALIDVRVEQLSYPKDLAWRV